MDPGGGSASRLLLRSDAARWPCRAEHGCSRWARSAARSWWRLAASRCPAIGPAHDSRRGSASRSAWSRWDSPRVVVRAARCRCRSSAWAMPAVGPGRRRRGGVVPSGGLRVARALGRARRDRRLGGAVRLDPRAALRRRRCSPWTSAPACCCRGSAGPRAPGRCRRPRTPRPTCWRRCCDETRFGGRADAFAAAWSRQPARPATGTASRRPDRRRRGLPAVGLAGSRAGSTSIEA